MLVGWIRLEMNINPLLLYMEALMGWYHKVGCQMMMVLKPGVLSLEGL